MFEVKKINKDQNKQERVFRLINGSSLTKHRSTSQALVELVMHCLSSQVKSYKATTNTCFFRTLFAGEDLKNTYGSDKRCEVTFHLPLSLPVCLKENTRHSDPVQTIHCSHFLWSHPSLKQKCWYMQFQAIPCWSHLSPVMQLLTQDWLSFTHFSGHYKSVISTSQEKIQKMSIHPHMTVITVCYSSVYTPPS